MTNPLPITGRRYEFDDSVRRFVATFDRVEHGVTLDPPDDGEAVSVYYFTDRAPYATAVAMAIRAVTA